MFSLEVSKNVPAIEIEEVDVKQDRLLMKHLDFEKTCLPGLTIRDS